MDLRSLIQRALEIRRQYARLEQQTYGRSWTAEELTLGFVGDVGDLVKLVMAESGVRDIPAARQKLAHELADCLWSIIVLADAFEIDLPRAFAETMDELEQQIASRLAAAK
jgi:NTP pyrophosphatase (non-canonical NTP hydrolase)